MEFRVLKYFLTVAREENMTKAAEILYITQPTLSRQIAELEEEVGTPLFVRSNRNVTLTDAGVLLRRRVEELLALERKIKDEFMAKENIGGTVSIGMAEAASAEYGRGYYRGVSRKISKCEIRTVYGDGRSSPGAY